MPDRPQRPCPWLLLVHQLPSEPSRLRVKAWRRLQGAGAVALKSSVYALPNTAEAREDFEWIRGEIVAEGGEAMVFEAQTADGISSTEIRAALERARAEDWRALLDQCEQALVAEGARGSAAGAASGMGRRLRTLRARAARLDKIDHLGAAGRREAMAALRRLEQLARQPDEAAPAVAAPSPRRLADYQKRRWVTRPRPGVDRMASAWLIRRFIDPQARFGFAERVPDDGSSVPFDMFGVELGHQGERVTFETLLAEFGVGDQPLARLARIVSELDRRAEVLSDAEAPTVERLVDGLRRAHADDETLLDRGMAIFEALYESFAASG